MKKIITLLICVAMVFQLSACGFISDLFKNSNGTDIITDPTSESDTSVIIPKTPLVAVSLPVVTESAAATDNAVVFNYMFQNISLITPDADVSDKVIIDFLNRIDATRKRSEEIYNLAQAEYAQQADWNPYLFMVSYSPMRIDGGVLSLFGKQVSYLGTPHPESVYSTINYDLATGDAVTLGDILTDAAAIDSLLQLVLDILAQQKEDLYLYEGYTQTVQAHFTENNYLQNSWYFTDNGLCFYFPPYDIAPYATGVVTAEIPYEKLIGILKDAYYPAEQDTAPGTIEVSLFTQEDMTQYTRFAEIVLDAAGDHILLHTDTIAENIRIESGTWSATGSFYTTQQTVFAASSIIEGDAIMVEAEINQTPTLRLCYESDGNMIRAFIVKDDKGNIVLINDNSH